MLHVTKEEYWRWCEEGKGVCLRCGEHFYDIPNHAKDWHCPDCGQCRVHGMESLVSLNLINISLPIKGVTNEIND